MLEFVLPYVPTAGPIFAFVMLNIAAVPTLPQLPGGFSISNYLSFIVGGMAGAYLGVDLSGSFATGATEVPILLAGGALGAVCGGLGLVGLKYYLWTLVKKK